MFIKRLGPAPAERDPPDRADRNTAPQTAQISMCCQRAAPGPATSGPEFAQANPGFDHTLPDLTLKCSCRFTPLPDNA